MPGAIDREQLVDQLARAGFVAAEEDADDLLAHVGDDPDVLGQLLARRLSGEPLAWLTGHVRFCDIDVLVHPGIYVPRWQTEALARRAADLLPQAGIAIDLCTGSGAIAKVLRAARPGARVLASDLDGAAVACAATNGVEAYLGDLFDPLPADFRSAVDVVVGVPPYVPTNALPLLQRDTFTFETPLAYDGGADGAAVLRRAIAGSATFLRDAGALLLELGGEQAELMAVDLERYGFAPADVLVDDDGDVRGIETRLLRAPGPL